MRPREPSEVMPIGRRFSSEANPLYPMVARVQHMNLAAAVENQGPGVMQLAGASAVRAPTSERVPVERELLHPVIAVLADVHVPAAVERQVVRIIQLARRASLAAPGLQQVALGVEHL